MTSLRVSPREERFDVSGRTFPAAAIALGIGGLILLSNLFWLSVYSGAAGGGAPGDNGLRDTIMPGELPSSFM